MAKISNTTVYPNIIPTANDYVVLTDVNDNNETKTSTVTNFQKFFGTQTVEVVLTPSDILNITTNPVTLVTAPSVTEFIIPISWAWKLTFNSVAYDFNPAEFIYITTATGGQNAFLDLPAGLFDLGYDNVAGGSTSYNAMGQSPLSEDLILWGTPPTAPATVGDSEIQLNIQYRIVKF
jgi:hypothetical protein